MSGFTIFHHTNWSAVPIPLGEGRHFHFVDEGRNKHFHFHYHGHHRFAKDNAFVETDRYILGIDGVLLNLQDLKVKTGIHQLDRILIQLYQSYQEELPQYLRGEFVGFLFDKNNQRLFFYGNQTATRKAFYTQIENALCIAPKLGSLVALQQAIGKKNQLNHRAAYALLSYGATLDRQTLVDSVYRMRAGEWLQASNNQIQLNSYIDYNNVVISKSRKSELIDQLDHWFTQAIYREYQKDVEYGYQHLATLSGGLDSRMNVMLAAKQGFHGTHFCFSQSDYPDEHIARQISQHLKSNFHFIPLDEVPQVYDLTENVDLYDGTLFYLSSAHFNHALKQLDLDSFGLIHTGMIGDGILGGLLSSPQLNPPNVRQKLLSHLLFPKIEKEVTELAKSYSCEDSFHLYNRVFNLTNSSAFVCEQHSYLVSPFMYPEFIQLCLSIPPQMKYREKIYLEWINKIHPDLNRFVWEKTGFRPSHHWKTQLSRLTQKIRHLTFHRLGQENRLSMTPYDYWYRNDERFQTFYQEQLKRQLPLLSDHLELQKDVQNLFDQGNAIEKSMALSLLIAVKKYQLSC
ncbi:MAG: asparagine synthetase B family protein [Bacteroidota bacterium]